MYFSKLFWSRMSLWWTDVRIYFDTCSIHLSCDRHTKGFISTPVRSKVFVKRIDRQRISKTVWSRVLDDAQTGRFISTPVQSRVLGDRQILFSERQIDLCLLTQVRSGSRAMDRPTDVFRRLLNPWFMRLLDQPTYLDVFLSICHATDRPTDIFRRWFDQSFHTKDRSMDLIRRPFDPGFVWLTERPI